MALPAASGAETHDVDNLLAGYRTALAQEALFDVRGGAATGYDEFVDAAGNVRPAWQELAEGVGERGRLLVVGAQDVEREPLRAALADPGKPRQLRDQAGDRAGLHGRRP